MLRGVVCLMVISGNQFLVGCKSPTSSPKHVDREVSPTTAELKLQLADSRIDAAKAQMSSHRQDRAMALLISALGIHPESSEAITLVREILAKTRWNFPVKSIKHHFPIEHIALADSSSTAWVGLRGKSSTLVRWNLNESAVESILFPVADTEVRSLIISPVGNYLVVERGDSAVLCNARTLKPIRNLGKIPEAMTPASAITFSNDGLLVAHPVREEGKPTSIVWNIRDAATGELIRSSEARLPDASQALAAALNQTTLTVFHDDGSLMEFPVSPVETGKESPFSEPLKLNFADFSADGESVLALQNRGPHEPSEAIVISYHGAEDGTLTQENLWKRFSWSRHPNRWRNFAGAAESPMMIARDQSMLFSSGSLAPIHSAAEITAAAFDGHSIVSGDTAGNLTVHRLIPPPMVNAALEGTSDGRANVETLKSLAVAVGGIRFDETTRTFLEISVSDRLAEISKLNSEVLGRSFPGYNFAKFVEDLNALRFRKVQPEAMLPVWDRLAQSDYQGNSWKSLLDATADLASSPWRKSLVEAEEKRANLNGSHQGKSHFIGEFALDEAGRENDSSEFLTAIGALPGEGPAIAHALSRALVSENSAWINACLAGRNPPNLIFQIARSRIAWLEGRKADALAPWSENFPSLDQARLHQDWNGWEQADFTPALELIRLSFASSGTRSPAGRARRSARPG